MSNELTRFQEMFAYLDAALTEKPWKDVVHTARSQKITPNKLFYDAYYLSDCGYSRVRVGYATLDLYISSESLDKPKNNWKNCKELISDIETFIQNNLKNDLKGDGS